jgi:hypothetical protein
MFGNSRSAHLMMTEDHPTPDVSPPTSARPRLPFATITDIARLPAGERWLVEGFLAAASITVLASTPKAGKTWVALALAVAVASGTPALGRFHVSSPGPVLLFPAEDDPRAIRERIESICLGQRVAFEGLPIHVITADALRLDDAAHREQLEELLEHLRPKFLVLDPLVRLHAGAESYVGHVAELFRYLRALQRRFQLAILLTHHVAKNRSSTAQPGQAMRGSGDIHAAYDHGATLQRQDDGSLILALEHRSAPSPEPLTFRILSKTGGATTFELSDVVAASGEEDASESPAPRTGTASSLCDRVVDLLRRSTEPVSQVSIRKTLHVRNETLTTVLRDLERAAVVENLGRMKGWKLKGLEAPASA